jgi:hypothetical protein
MGINSTIISKVSRRQLNGCYSPGNFFKGGSPLITFIGEAYKGTKTIKVFFGKSTHHQEQGVQKR